MKATPMNRESIKNILVDLQDISCQALTGADRRELDMETTRDATMLFIGATIALELMGENP